MRRQRRFVFLLLAVVIISAAVGTAVLAEETEEQYIKNEWNFVDGSMDVSQGIPDNASGVLANIRDARTWR